MARWGPRALGGLLVASTVAASLVTVPARAGTPTRPGALDCTNWRYGPADEPAPGVLPPEFDRNNYKRTSRRDPRFAHSPHEHCGQKGGAVDLAWGVSQGRDDVRIAVLDSGIKWRDAGAMRDLAPQAYLNPGEAAPACGAHTPDCNGDGAFDIADFGSIADRNGNGLSDPEDLILDPAYSDGVDDDGNGWVDDISGWDFLYGDNNPLDTVAYGHGTGEAQDSTAAANGAGDVGTCPECRFIPVRVGDSFVADGARFAAGVLFGLDSGADVIQEALGALNNPRQAQQAIDAAYRRGVVVVASMADEAAKHPNLPSSLEHTMAVNSVTEKEPLPSGPVEGYLALNGCTNFGGRTFVAVESGSCSSEATGISSGIVGLAVATARDAGLQLSANELMQVVRATADDIDFSTPNAVDPANDFGTPTGGLLDTVRYPTTRGWDATFGHGRLNAYELVKAIRDRRIPPEADITAPKWFDVLPATGVLRVRGRVAAPRATSYDYRVEWTTGLQPPPYPGRDQWRVVQEHKNLRVPFSGLLGVVHLGDVADALPRDGRGTPVDSSGRPAEERFTVRLRVVVTAHGGPSDGRRGEMQKHVFVHDDPDLVRGLPARVRGVGTSSPVFVDLDDKLGDELLVATDDGLVHAYSPGLHDVTGWPVAADPSPIWNPRSPTTVADRIATPGSAFMVGAPAVADVDRDGDKEVVAADIDGRVYVWDDSGRRVARAEIDPAYARDDPAAQDSRNRTKHGIAGSPALGDLDGDGDLEIVVAALDRHVYAFHHDGRGVRGFPVLVVDPAKVQAIDPVTHRVTFTAGSGVDIGGELVATPALADLTGDRRAEIVVGAQEQYREPPNSGTGADVLGLISLAGTAGNSRLYVISPDGTRATNPDRSAAHPHDHAYLPGWPFAIPQLLLDVLPTIGDGVSAQVAIGEVTSAHAGREIVAASSAGPLYVLGVDGRSVYGEVGGRAVPATWSAGLAGQTLGDYGPLRNSSDLVATTVAFGGPAIGVLDPGPRRIVAPTAGFTRLTDTLGADLQPPNDDQLMGWDGDTGRALPGFPQATTDLGFFVTPAIADLDGDGRREVVAGNGVHLLHAHRADGTRPSGWPKLTGGWLVGTPGLGDWDGDGRAELAVVRRDGVLLVWHTRADRRGLAGGWPRFGCDPRNSGACAGS